MTEPTHPRRFHLQRDRDITGVSGTGVVAHGVMWPDGTASVRWDGVRPSVVFWDGGMADAEHVHGHGGATRIVWDDPEPVTVTACQSAADMSPDAADALQALAAVARSRMQDCPSGHPAPDPGLREALTAAIRKQAETGNVRYDAIADAVLPVVAEHTARELERITADNATLAEERDKAVAERDEARAEAKADRIHHARIDADRDRLAAELADEKTRAADYDEYGDRQRHRAERAEKALREVLAEFTHKTHPGERCLQSGHVPVATVERWRAVLNPPTDTPEA